MGLEADWGSQHTNPATNVSEHDGANKSSLSMAMPAANSLNAISSLPELVRSSGYPGALRSYPPHRETIAERSKREWHRGFGGECLGIGMRVRTKSIPAPHPSRRPWRKGKSAVWAQGAYRVAVFQPRFRWSIWGLAWVPIQRE